jgi:hypothetical protein
MLLIPATTAAWTPADAEDTYDGTYLAVNCKIYNVAGVAYNSESDVCLHSGWAVIPVSFDWEPGKKYTYTLTITQEYIKFNEPGVDIWDEENATGSVVIK